MANFIKFFNKKALKLGNFYIFCQLKFSTFGLTWVGQKGTIIRYRTEECQIIDRNAVTIVTSPETFILQHNFWSSCKLSL